MTGHPGDEPYRPGRLVRAVASLLGLPSAGRRSRFTQPCNNTDRVGTAQAGNTDLLDGLTPEGRHVLDVARNEAWNLGQTRVGTEHLLLALTRNPETGACRAMDQMATSPLRVQADVLGSLTGGVKTTDTAGAEPAPGLLGLTPRARLAVQLAHRASARIGVPATAPEHLLIGLAAEGEGIAAKALRKSGMTAGTVEKRVASGIEGRTTEP